MENPERQGLAQQSIHAETSIKLQRVPDTESSPYEDAISTEARQPSLVAGWCIKPCSWSGTAAGRGQSGASGPLRGRSWPPPAHVPCHL